MSHQGLKRAEHSVSLAAFPSRTENLSKRLKSIRLAEPLLPSASADTALTLKKTKYIAGGWS
jgi:hypothetical protein